ncbi:L-aspartate oxidase [Microbacterium stercoris]|uniref:L-aspartate oxidase n=1 Tax=Microbacterium stercoris TaxID=2820289 RepID=A0A939QGE2_9MICO|nr:L-aspartate oxidase [Microbacterium stercoris]MBO3662283.1 L-aspartate oxidase [Microbacterium stercoris]
MGATHAVVVGSGIAALTFALHAVQRGVEVTIVTKGCADQGSTRHAQGGIAGVVFPGDSIDDHVADTLTAGAGLCDPHAVSILVTEGPERIRELIDWGVAFDRDREGRLLAGLEAAHSQPRILHAGGDATGLAIESALLRAAREAGVRIVEHAFLKDLVVVKGRVLGVRVGHEGRTAVLAADAVVLATGGIGQVFERTTNPLVATGDGIAAALRAGAAVQDLEFVQFHPTVLATGTPFLVSEAVRGEGAVLLDDQGRHFAFDAHPDGELAPRDVVARACAAAGSVRLDATAIPDLATRFPSIDAAVRDRGLDWSATAVPVTPAAHYVMGGIVTDVDGRTTLPGLYAIGECARTGVHGANRLASNSLLEGAVFGARAAAAVSEAGRPRRGTLPTWDGPIAPAPPRDAHAPRDGARGAAEVFTRAALQRLMWTHAGLLRDGDGLAFAGETIAAWRAGSRDPVTVAEHEDANLLMVAEAVVAAAFARRDSAGAHWRTDAPLHTSRELATAGAL